MTGESESFVSRIQMIKTYYLTVLRDTHNITAHGYCSRSKDGGCPQEFYSVSLRERQFSRDVPAEVFPCDKDTVIGDTLKKRHSVHGKRLCKELQNMLTRLCVND